MSQLGNKHAYLATDKHPNRISILILNNVVSRGLIFMYA